MSAIVEFRKFSAWYGEAASLQEITLLVPAHEILGIIGPAGGGKTTLLRSLNRMNDFDPRFRCQGGILYHGIDLYQQPVDVAVLRRKMGMV
ncbi:MAG: ATP-binding cassette domain-containing protein, partial [Planctomycetes bacterium]|nr:ATP-binding cassette domain-containing protein [Planctomycetota bacterium]